jgi:hypothetical protein
MLIRELQSGGLQRDREIQREKLTDPDVKIQITPFVHLPSKPRQAAARLDHILTDVQLT